MTPPRTRLKLLKHTPKPTGHFACVECGTSYPPNDNQARRGWGYCSRECSSTASGRKGAQASSWSREPAIPEFARRKARLGS